MAEKDITEKTLESYNDVFARENRDYVPNRETIRHVQEVLQLMAVMTADTRFEEAYQEKGSGTNMCEFLDRLEARGHLATDVYQFGRYSPIYILPDVQSGWTHSTTCI